MRVFMQKMFCLVKKREEFTNFPFSVSLFTLSVKIQIFCFCKSSIKNVQIVTADYIHINILSSR